MELKLGESTATVHGAWMWPCVVSIMSALRWFRKKYQTQRKICQGSSQAVLTTSLSDSKFETLRVSVTAVTLIFVAVLSSVAVSEAELTKPAPSGLLWGGRALGTSPAASGSWEDDVVTTADADVVPPTARVLLPGSPAFTAPFSCTPRPCHKEQHKLL